MVKYRTTLNNVKDIESYLALSGYKDIRIIGNCALMAVEITAKDIPELSVFYKSKRLVYGVMSLSDFHWIVNPEYLIEKDTELVDNLLAEKGFVVLSKYRRVTNQYGTDVINRFITVVDVENEDIVMQNKRRSNVIATERYIITVKEVEKNSTFRCSFIDINTRKLLDTRVNTSEIFWAQGMTKLGELTCERYLGMCKGYAKIPTYGLWNREFNLPEGWGKAYIYVTDDGIESEMGLIKRLYNPVLIRLYTTDNSELDLDESVIKQEFYFWADKTDRNWNFYSRHWDIIGRKSRVMFESEKPISELLSKVIDAIEEGKLSQGLYGEYSYGLSTVEDYRTALKKKEG